MKLTIVHIINNKLHNFEYLNYTILFYIILLYTYYSLFIYLLNKNYILLLLYFTFFILVYNSYKNFTYIIGLVILIILKIFDIDTILNSNSINLVNIFTNVKVENLDVMDKIKAKADNKRNELEEDSNNNNPQPNPAKTYIIDAVQKLGLTISNNQYNYKDKEKDAQFILNDKLPGHRKPPAIIKFNSTM